jgi:hypothetical protein
MEVVMSLPLTPGDPVSGEKFYKGRLIYVDSLKTKINKENQSVIYLLGPRRIGKTSIIKEYFKQQNEDTNHDGIYLYFYCASVTNIVEFYNYVNEQIAKELKKVGEISKFQEVTLRIGTKFHQFRNSIRSALKKVNVKEVGIELNDPKEWDAYKEMVGKLKIEFLELIAKFEMERVVLGFDEVPEAIQNILKANKERGEKEIKLWLEHFREIRQVNSSQGKIQMILFGSVNMKLSLERIGMTNVINDGNNIDVEPLSIEDVQTMFWELSDNQKINEFFDNKHMLDHFLHTNFTYSSPWAVQNFVSEYTKLTVKTKIEQDIKDAYLKLFDISNGPRYFNERLSKYYQASEIKQAKHILTFIVSTHVDGGVESIDVKDIHGNFKATFAGSWEDFKIIMDILTLDNILVRKVDHYLIQNTVEKNFWYQQLVGPCKI